MVTTIKPKLWNYKTGIKAGKLRPKAKEYLSFKLTEFHKEKRIREEIIKEQLIPKRMRTQLTLNSDYAVSLRAISTSGHTEQELQNAITEFLNSNPSLELIPFDTEGFEEEELDAKEDIGLGDRITIELNIRGQTTYSEI